MDRNITKERGLQHHYVGVPVVPSIVPIYKCLFQSISVFTRCNAIAHCCRGQAEVSIFNSSCFSG